MAKKKREEEHVNHERWMVSFADFTTLLFAFFTVMYAVSKQDDEFATEVAESVRWAMQFRGEGGKREPGLLPDAGLAISSGRGNSEGLDEDAHPDTRRSEIEKTRENLESRLVPFLDRISDPEAVTVSVEGDRLVIKLKVSRFFDVGSVAIRPQVLPIIDLVAAELRRLDRLVRVEGHSDSLPLHSGGRFRDNWELSASRAAAVTSYIQRSQSFPGEHLAATGLADTRPVATNETHEGREANRRIELLVEFEPGEIRDPEVDELVRSLSVQ